MKKKHKNITPKEWQNIKTLIDAGLKGKILENITNRSSATHSYISRSSSFEDYRNLIIEKIEQRKAKRLIKKDLKEKQTIQKTNQKQYKDEQYYIDALEVNTEVMKELIDKLDELKLEISDASEGKSGFFSKIL